MIVNRPVVCSLATPAAALYTTPRWLLTLAWLLCLSHTLSAALPGAEEVELGVGEAGVTRGLIVVIGSEDGTLERDLAKAHEGRVLVHGHAATEAACDKARETLRAAGVYGLASVERSADLSRLPYPDHMVNLLIADLDATQGLTRDEAMRVVIPGFGVAYLREGGTWSRVEKPADPKMGEWTHMHGNPQNNPVSTDETIRPINTVKWIDGFGRFGRSMGGGGGFPVVGQGIMIHEDNRGRNVDEVDARRASQRLYGRDAFNGLAIWADKTSSRRLPMTLVPGAVVSAYEPTSGDDRGNNLYSRDLMTGKILRTLDADVKERGPERDTQPVFKNGVVYAAVANKLIAWKPETGEVLWTYEPEAAADQEDGDKGRGVLFSPSVTPDGTRIIFAQRGGRQGRGTDLTARWAWVEIEAITCLDTQTGKVLWRNTDLNSLHTAHMPVDDEHVLFYATWGIGSHYERIERGAARDKLTRDIGVLDAHTGKVKWRKTRQDDDNAIEDLWVQVGMIHHGMAWLSESRRFLAYDLDTGELKRSVGPAVVNQRCTRTRALPDYLLTGFGMFYDIENNRYVDQNIARSACAVGTTPAYGMLYEQSNGCGCFAMIRNYAGFATQEEQPTLPEDRRLDTTPRNAERGGKVVQRERAPVTHEGKDNGPPTFRLTVITDQPIRDSWRNNEELPFPETDPVRVDLPGGPADLVSVVSEHRLEARRGDDILWAFTADARITGAPLVKDSRVYFGGHDGYLYCLDAATGDMHWRYLIAPTHRRIAAFGQLESAWPIRGIAEYQGLICGSAGRHPELDGGIFIAALDPATGKPQWTQVISQPTAEHWHDADKRVRGEDRYLNWITNGSLFVKDDRLMLKGHDWVHGGGNKSPRLEPFPVQPQQP